MKKTEETIFLEQYNPSEFDRPSVTVDIAILTVKNKQLEVVTVKRNEHPFLGYAALPGGFVGILESLDSAAARVLKSKANLENVYLEQLFTFGNPNRDPRMRIISVAYYALVPNVQLENIQTQNVGSVQLAFDHNSILETALKRIQGKLEYAAIGTSLLPKKFTLRELQDVHETILGKPLNKDAFRRKILSTGQLEPTGILETGQGFRPAEYYSVKAPERRNNMQKISIKDGAFTIKHFFTRGESENMIQRAEQIGFSTATVNVTSGATQMLGVRNNDRVKFDDIALADTLWKRLEPHIPTQLEDWTASRLNECFAVYRYTAGQRFKRHQDGVVETDQGEESRFTVLIYLNEECQGGETIFSDADRSGSRVKFINTNVQPETGMTLVFNQELWHEGAEVISGTKYVLRTDVLYKKN
jgi:8-oxo-dGTP diphosphatase